MPRSENQKTDIVYPDLSYKIVGALFEVHNELGPDLQEKHYQRGVALELTKRGVHFSEQLMIPLTYQGKSIGKYFLDFLVEDKVVLEIKKDRNFNLKNIKQVSDYLKAKGYKLGILANFTQEGVKYKRILNLR